jgi:hypothetical protein
MSAADIAETGRSWPTGVSASAGNGIPPQRRRSGRTAGLHVARPCVVRRDGSGRWVWSCWLCPAPACWIEHRAGSWPAAIGEADTHAHTPHRPVPEAHTPEGWAA